jgi:hypothetical protein
MLTFGVSFEIQKYEFFNSLLFFKMVLDILENSPILASNVAIVLVPWDSICMFRKH